MRTLLLLLLAFNVTAQDTWQFAADKQKHFIAGSVISMVTTSVLNGYKPTKQALLIGFSTGVGAGVLKEGFDALGYGTSSHQDLAYAIMGAGVGTLVGYGLSEFSKRIDKRATQKREFKKL